MSLLSNTWFQQGGLITGQSRLRFQSNFEQGTYMHVYRTCSYLILQCRTILNLIFFFLSGKLSVTNLILSSSLDKIMTSIVALHLVYVFSPVFKQAFRYDLQVFTSFFAAHMQLGNIPPVYLIFHVYCTIFYAAIFKIKCMIIHVYLYITWKCGLAISAIPADPSAISIQPRQLKFIYCWSFFTRHRYNYRYFKNIPDMFTWLRLDYLLYSISAT